MFVPTYIQYRIDTIDPNAIQLESLIVHDFNAQGLTFDIKAALPALFFLPIKAGFGPCQFTLYDSANDILTQIDVPYIDFMLNDELKLDFSGQILMENANRTAIKEHLSTFSTHQGLVNVNLDARSAVPIYAMGIQFYSGMALHRSLPLGDVKSDLKSLMNILPPFVKNHNSSKFLFQSSFLTRKQTMKQNFILKNQTSSVFFLISVYPKSL